MSREEGESLAQTLGYPFLETSVQTNTNIHEAFNIVIREIADLGLIDVYRSPEHVALVSTSLNEWLVNAHAASS